jgi:hypothetical protein
VVKDGYIPMPASWVAEALKLLENSVASK